VSEGRNDNDKVLCGRIGLTFTVFRFKEKRIIPYGFMKYQNNLIFIIVEHSGDFGGLVA